MNQRQLFGITVFVLGFFQILIGKLVGNRNLELRGFHNKIAGSAHRAIGEAQQIIKICTRRQTQGA